MKRDAVVFPFSFIQLSSCLKFWKAALKTLPFTELGTLLLLIICRGEVNSRAYI